MPRFYPLEATSVRRETPDAVSVTFAVPDDLSEAFAFRAGQYLTLRALLDGEEVRRSYSLCAPPGAPLRVGIKKVDGGKFSTYAHDRLQPGDIVEVMPPSGRFVCAEPQPAGLSHVAFAAGSGITPILSILRHALETREADRFTLFYGNRAQSSVMFLDELHQLKDRFLGRLQLFHLLSREASDVPLFRGRLDKDKVLALRDAHLLEPRRLDVAYICGPGSMIDEVSAGLAASDVPPERIRAERFASKAPASKPKTQGTEGGVSVEVLLDGARRAFVAHPGESLIDAGSRQGIDLPYSCAGGMCSTCRCRLVEGEAEMQVNYSLEGWELERGFILACQTVPKSSRLVLDFDGQ